MAVLGGGMIDNLFNQAYLEQPLENKGATDKDRGDCVHAVDVTGFHRAEGTYAQGDTAAVAGGLSRGVNDVGREVSQDVFSEGTGEDGVFVMDGES